VFTINDLPSKYNHFYNELDSIRILFGDYYIVDAPLSVVDSLPDLKRQLDLVFHDYHNRDEVLDELIKLSLVIHIRSNSFIGTHTGSVYHSIPKNIEIFPNPSTKIINLKSKELIQSIFIFDIRGTEIDHNKAPKIEQIDVSDIPIGTYFLLINDKYIHKFIKD
jgi:hypothetical protein